MANSRQSDLTFIHEAWLPGRSLCCTVGGALRTVMQHCYDAARVVCTRHNQE